MASPTQVTLDSAGTYAAFELACESFLGPDLSTRRSQHKGESSISFGITKMRSPHLLASDTVQRDSTPTERRVNRR